MTNNQTSISLIIAFYNEELYLDRCLQSVANQTYKNIEVILINDGSTDNSLQIAEKYLNTFENVKLISIENSGPGIARNKGLEIASGNYLAFLDADDALDNNALRKMLETLVKTKSDMVMSLFKMFDKNNNVIKESVWNFEEILDSKKVISLVVSEKFIPTVWGKLFKTSIAQKSRFLETYWKEDDVFILNYLIHSKKITILKEYLISINCRNNSLTRQVLSQKMIEDISISYGKQFQILSTQDSKDILKNLIENQINTFLNLFLILQIDFNQIENKSIVLNTYYNKIYKINQKSKNYPISLKKKMVLFFLVNSKKIGLKNSFFWIKILKYKTSNSLKKIKS